MNRHPAKTAVPARAILHRAQDASRHARRGGFALLITVTLLAFLVLLLVSLATLTRVETQVAANNQQLAQARQNALMALNVALGQLQKYAGPDQRTTAEADLTFARQPNSRWTGVYGSSVAANYTDAPETVAAALTDASKVDATTGSSAKLLTWLVSGNELAPFDPAADVGSSGEIATVPAVAAIPYRPDQTVQNLSAGEDPNATDITLNTKPAQLLVGPGSTNTDLPTSGSSTPVDYVIAPLVDIKVPASQVPGLAPSDPDPTVGRYAWWVGDEGVKARVNLPRTSSTDVDELNNAFVSSTRDAIELMSGTTATATTGPITSVTAARIGASAYDIDRAPSLVTPGQLPMLNTASSTLPVFSKNRFHDLTADSYSVLSDTYAGGLKKDLTRLLIDGQTTTADSSSTTNPLNTTADSPLFAPSSAASIDNYIPTWGFLRSYTQLTSTGGVLTPRLPTPAQAGISPVLTYFSLGFRYATVGPVADGAAIQVNLYPIVVLWNPYTVPIEAHDYEVGIAPAPYMPVTAKLQTRTPADPATTPPTPAGAWTDIAGTSCNFTSITTNNAGKPEYIIFGLTCPRIDPGQSLVFALPSGSKTTYSNIGTAATKLINATPSSGAYVTLPLSGTIPTGQSGNDFQVVCPQFKNGSGGVLAMYLGDPSSKPATTNFDSNLDPYSTSIPKQWYQADQGIGWDGIVVPGNANQTGLLSTSDPSGQGPSFVVYAQAVFSAQGSNAKIDYNGQDMIPSRWIAQGNMRAPITARTRLDTNYNVLYSAYASPNTAYDPWMHFTMGSPSGSTIRASAGLGHDWSGTPSAPVDVTLWEVRPPSQTNLFSIGQLQQAPLSTVGAYPSYAVGNSLADFRLSAGTLLATTSAVPSPSKPLSSTQKAYYDVSWLLNRTLWDHYFFSTVPGSGALPATLPNPRLSYYGTPSSALQDVNRAATGLLVKGGFNINSTSEQAWRAVLGGVSRLGYDPVSRTAIAAPASGTSAPAPLSRFSQPTADDDPNSVWQGYRTLTEQQVAQLARDIVTEIRARGPFVSLADFINRRLVDTSDSAPNAFGLKGTLQAALDARLSTSSTVYATNDAKSGSFWATNSATASASGSQYNQQNFAPNHTLGNIGSAKNPISNRSAYAPKYLTQADILSTIGSTLSARSDTFRIRTYGEVRNPMTNDVTGRAWCEAIVQRVPDYVESDDSPESSPTTTANKLFGRQFKIVSFRWLAPSDI